jgi:hypothetical protein
VSCSLRAAFAALLFDFCAATQPQIDESGRLNQHKVTNASSPAQEPGAELQQIPSLLDGVHSAKDWRNHRRPEVIRLWTNILGKLAPNRRDRKWFGDIRRATIRESTDRGTYTRILLDLPIEKTFCNRTFCCCPRTRAPVHSRP